MGCDYYKCLYLCVEYMIKEKKELMEILLEKNNGYFYGAYDSDSEDDYDRKNDEQMESIEKNYGVKIIFDQNSWKISSNNKIEEYKNHLKRSIPQESEIIKITKFIRCEIRD